MPETRKARLIELDETLREELPGGRSVTVPFNPESLKLTFANQVQNNQPSTGGGSGADQSQGSAGRQFVGTGTTKLAVTLWFDAATASPPVSDVRQLTGQVIYFITPRPTRADPSRFTPPGVRFHWGSFNFDGLVDGIEETIDYFSPDGHPLRANLSLTLSQQTILVGDRGAGSRPPGVGAGSGGGLGDAVGTLQGTLAAAGSTLQGLAAAAAGAAAGALAWQRIAQANGIDNPRALTPGQVVFLGSRGSAGGTPGGMPR
jgi:hypothetical protein